MLLEARHLQSKHLLDKAADRNEPVRDEMKYEDGSVLHVWAMPAVSHLYVGESIRIDLRTTTFDMVTPAIPANTSTQSIG